jgi:hypothetical protein
MDGRADGRHRLRDRSVVIIAVGDELKRHVALAKIHIHHRVGHTTSGLLLKHRFHHGRVYQVPSAFYEESPPDCTVVNILVPPHSKAAAAGATAVDEPTWVASRRRGEDRDRSQDAVRCPPSVCDPACRGWAGRLRPSRPDGPLRRVHYPPEQRTDAAKSKVPAAPGDKQPLKAVRPRGTERGTDLDNQGSSDAPVAPFEA